MSTITRHPALGASSEPQSLQIYQQLRWGLVIGDFQPGDAMSIRKIASDLGAGQMPVREAIKRLASERALTSATKRSFRVPQLAAKQVSDLFFVRSRLEGIATELATPVLTLRQIDRLVELAAQMDEDIDNGDVRKFLSRNYTFHFTIYTAARNQELVHVIDTLWARSGPFLAESVRQQNLSVDWRVFHSRIAEAIRMRDADEARKLIETDINWGIEEFQKLASTTPPGK